MPTLQDITNISISLQTTGVSRTGFGTPIFIGSHRAFNERIRSYTSLTAAAVDFSAGSEELAAMTAFFSQDVAPSTVKVGRREADVTLTPDTPAEDDVFSVTVTDTDGDSIVASYTAVALDVEEEIVDGLKAVIDGDPNVSVHVTATKNGTGASATLTLSPVAPSTDTYSIATLVKLTDAYTSSEVAGDVITAIETVDSDFYFVTAHDHTETFVLAMAAVVEAKSKMYFVSNQDQDTLATIADPATDTLGKLFDGNYFRTAGIYNHEADTKFTECAFVGRGAPATPGTITWANKQLAGVAVSSDSLGVNLTATQEGYVAERNANFIQDIGGVAATRQGLTAGGEWIDIIRSRDFLEARITEVFQNKLLNAPKIPYTQLGIESLRGLLSSTLTRFVSTANLPNILEETTPFTIDFADIGSVSFADKQARTFTGSFVGNLAGAIHVITITGTLTYSGA